MRRRTYRWVPEFARDLSTSNKANHFSTAGRHRTHTQRGLASLCVDDEIVLVLEYTTARRSNVVDLPKVRQGGAGPLKRTYAQEAVHDYIAEVELSSFDSNLAVRRLELLANMLRRRRGPFS